MLWTQVDMTFREQDDWKCHPDLAADWQTFSNVCRGSAASDLTGDLWMKFYRAELPATTGNDVVVGSDPCSETSGKNLVLEEAVSLEAKTEDQLAKLQVEDVALSDSQHQQISSINMELLDVLDMDSEGIPDELQEDIDSLPPHGIAVLLQGLKSQLTDQGAYNLCALLCEKKDGRPWINVSLVFEIIFFPMLCDISQKSIAEEVKAGLIQMAEHFPSECVSSLLKPLLASELKSHTHLDLLSGLVPSLSVEDFMSLLRCFVDACNAPIEEWRILVLNCLLSHARPDIWKTKVESPLLDLLPVLSASAKLLSASELFANLMLKVIPALKWNTSSKIQNELMVIVQQNNSFNKQTLMNAVKTNVS